MEFVLTIGRLLEINIGVSQGATCGLFPANPDWQNWSSSREFFEKHGFIDIGAQISHIKGGHLIVWSWIRTHLCFRFLCFSIQIEETKKQNEKKTEIGKTLMENFIFESRKNTTKNVIFQRQQRKEPKKKKKQALDRLSFCFLLFLCDTKINFSSYI